MRRAPSSCYSCGRLQRFVVFTFWSIAVLAILEISAPVACGTTFTPGHVFYADNASSPYRILDVTAGGNFGAAAPFTTTTNRSPGQFAWSPDLSTEYLTQFDTNSVVKISATGAVSTFATGISRPTGLIRLADGRLLAASFSSGAVYDITAGGDLSSAIPFATGLSGLRNFLETADHRILVASQNAGAVFNITAGGNFSSATPFASNLGPIADIVQDATSRIFVSQFTSNQVMNISAGGNFSSATPFATGQAFMGLAVDGQGRLLADVVTGSSIFNITAGGNFTAATPFATGLGFGESALDVVPSAVPEPTSAVLGGTSLALLGFVALRKKYRRVRHSAAI